MYATTLEFENKSELQSNLTQLQKELRIRQVPSVDPAFNTIEVFAKLPTAKQQEILSNISTYVRILAQAFEPEIERNNNLHEIARLRWALHCFGLKAKKQDVFNIVAPDDVIEVYNLQGVQLYRNVGFFKVCSYNLLDLSVQPWDMLYDKPTHVIEATHNVIHRLFDSGDDPIPYGIGTYLQKEKFEFADSLKTLKVTPKFIVPLYDINDGRPSGAFSTYSAELIAEGNQSGRFNTI